MRLSPPLRKAVLAVHLAVSVGWIGAVAAYLALDLAAASSADVATLRAAYLGMGLIAGRVIVPLALVRWSPASSSLSARSGAYSATGGYSCRWR